MNPKASDGTENTCHYPKTPHRVADTFKLETCSPVMPEDITVKCRVIGGHLATILTYTLIVSITLQ